MKLKQYALALLLFPTTALCLVTCVMAGEITITAKDTTGKALKNVVVYAEHTSEKKLVSSDKKPIDIVQEKKKFHPLVSVAQTGSYINFPNKDRVKHHVYSFSPAKTFELKLYSGRPAKPVQFDTVGTVTLGCNIHDRMLAFVHIVDTPYFGKTDTNGQLTLQGLPDGDYKLKAWHYAAKQKNAVIEQAITVKNKISTAFNIEINSNAIVGK